MPKVCYIEFEFNPTLKYAYLCGNLGPLIGQWVVIWVGKKDSRKRKLVRCVALGDADPKATALIAGVVQEQTS